MILVKNAAAAQKMRAAGHLLEGIVERLCEAVKPGVTTKTLGDMADRLICGAGAIPSFFRYGQPPFPASLCTSVDDAVIHGIPDDRPLREGSIIGIDCGLILGGWHADMARTVPVGTVPGGTERLIKVTKQCFFEALKLCREGYRLGDIGYAVQTYAEAAGYFVVTAFCGHGIGRQMHEDPQVPNVGTPGRGTSLRAGMTLAIEPMINAGTCDVDVDGWDVRTRDGSLSAHYENTVLITAGEPEVLTMRPAAGVSSEIPLGRNIRDFAPSLESTQ